MEEPDTHGGLLSSPFPSQQLRFWSGPQRVGPSHLSVADGWSVSHRTPACVVGSLAKLALSPAPMLSACPGLVTTLLLGSSHTCAHSGDTGSCLSRGDVGWPSEGVGARGLHGVPLSQHPWVVALLSLGGRCLSQQKRLSGCFLPRCLLSWRPLAVTGPAAPGLGGFRVG